MTALDQYQRLEAPAIWRADETAQRRDVIVSFGEATLTISSSSEIAVSHWSLAAVQRLNPGETPAIFSPGEDSVERLEIADETMVDAITQVQKAVVRLAPHPRRLRLILLGLLSVLIIGLTVFWLPGAMIAYTASVVPPSKRAEIGLALLTHIEDLTGDRCAAPLGRQALADMYFRLAPGLSGRVVVLPDGAMPSRHIPGGIILLNRSVVEDYDDPNAAAGYILAEIDRMSAADGLVEMLEETGLVSAFNLLTKGDIGSAALAGYAETLLRQTPDAVDQSALIERFRVAGISSSPFAYALDITGEDTVALIEGDPFPSGTAISVLSDDAWVSLQSICG